MLVKVEIQGEVATITNHPSEKERVNVTVPASRVRCRFAKPISGEEPEALSGYFIASNATAPLDFIELDEAVTPKPKERW